MKANGMAADRHNHESLIASLNEALRDGADADFWAVAPLFEEMGAEFVNNWSLVVLKGIVDGTAAPPYHDRGGILLHASRNFTISLTLLSYVPEYIYWYPQHYFAKNIGRLPVFAHRYALAKPQRNDLYDPEAELIDLGRQMLDPGAVMNRDGSREIVDWGESGQEGGLILRLHAIGTGPYEWAFDRPRKRAAGMTAIDPVASQMVSLLRLLSLVGAPDEQQLIEACLQSKFFHVRWEALKTMGALYPSAARQALNSLVGDPHPTIRRAAEKTLALNEGR
jgi:hypothetical protein